MRLYCHGNKKTTTAFKPPSVFLWRQNYDAAFQNEKSMKSVLFILHGRLRPGCGTDIMEASECEQAKEDYCVKVTAVTQWFKNRPAEGGERFTQDCIWATSACVYAYHILRAPVFARCGSPPPRQVFGRSAGAPGDDWLLFVCVGRMGTDSWLHDVTQVLQCCSQWVRAHVHWGVKLLGALPFGLQIMVLVDQCSRRLQVPIRLVKDAYRYQFRLVWSASKPLFIGCWICAYATRDTGKVYCFCVWVFDTATTQLTLWFISQCCFGAIASLSMCGSSLFTLQVKL